MNAIDENPRPTAKKASRLLNRSAVRAMLLEQYYAWGHTKRRTNVSTAVMDQTMKDIEESVQRLICGVASQGFPGRIGGARICARERNRP